MTTTEVKTETGTWKIYEEPSSWLIYSPENEPMARFADPLTMACNIAMLLSQILVLTGNSSSEEKS